MATTGVSGSGSGPPPGAAAAEREQKLLESATEGISHRIHDSKLSIHGLITKLETDPTVNWDTFLDSYSLISGQLNSLLKHVKMDRTPMLRKYMTLPLLLSPDRDEELAKLTENRVSTFSHDLVPDYLRTKPDPEVEAKHQQYESRANSVSLDQASKQLAVMEKVTMGTLKLIGREREDLESRANSRAEMEKTNAIEDTFNLVAAITSGKGLRMMTVTSVAQPSMGPNRLPNSSTSIPVPKAPSAIKTNIKAANQMDPEDKEKRRTLWVGGAIVPRVDEALLYELFINAGPLENVIIPMDKERNIPKSFAFVIFSHEESVPYAMQLFQQTKLFGRSLVLQSRNSSSSSSSGGTRDKPQSHVPFSECRRPQPYPRYRQEQQPSMPNFRRYRDDRQHPGRHNDIYGRPVRPHPYSEYTGRHNYRHY